MKNALKILDRYLGAAFTAILPRAQCVTTLSTLESILIIRPGGIGDAVLLAPLISSISTTYPHCTIDVLAEKRNAGVFQLVPGVVNVFCYDDFKSFSRVLARRYDVIVDSEQWHRFSSLVARLMRSTLKIGYGTNGRLRMFTHVIDYSHEMYEAESFCLLGAPLHLECDIAPPFLKVGEQVVEDVTQGFESLRGKPYVVLFPGGSIPERQWGADRFREIALRLSRDGYGVVVVGSDVDRADGETIAAGVSSALSLAGRCSLAQTAAIVDGAMLLVSGDSGILHVGVGLDKPTVSLFGPGIALKWAPRGARHRVINKGLTCSPCTRFGYTPRCPNGCQCMRDISVEEVFSAICDVISQEGLK